MKTILKLLVCSVLVLFAINSYGDDGQEPLVSTNVHVIQNTTSTQCPVSWKGRMYPDAMQTATGAGTIDSQTGPIVRSCTGCSFDSQSRDCVCSTCYDYYN